MLLRKTIDEQAILWNFKQYLCALSKFRAPSSYSAFFFDLYDSLFLKGKPLVLWSNL